MVSTVEFAVCGVVVEILLVVTDVCWTVEFTAWDVAVVVVEILVIVSDVCTVISKKYEKS